MYARITRRQRPIVENRTMKRSGCVIDGAMFHASSGRRIFSGRADIQ